MKIGVQELLPTTSLPTIADLPAPRARHCSKDSLYPFEAWGSKYWKLRTMVSLQAALRQDYIVFSRKNLLSLRSHRWGG